MNKILLGLLLLGAGAASYFYFQKNRHVQAHDPYDRQLLIGKWNEAEDSITHRVEFTDNGKLVLRVDSLLDTSYYEWGNKNALLFYKEKEDSLKKRFTVLQLGRDSLRLRAADSTEVLFLKQMEKD